MSCSTMCCNSSSIEQTMRQLFSANFLITPRRRSWSAHGGTIYAYTKALSGKNCLSSYSCHFVKNYFFLNKTPSCSQHPIMGHYRPPAKRLCWQASSGPVLRAYWDVWDVNSKRYVSPTLRYNVQYLFYLSKCQKIWINKILKLFKIFRYK